MRVRVEGRGLTTLTLDVATDVGTFGADVGPPPPPDVGTLGANVGGGGGTLTWSGGRCGGTVSGLSFTPMGIHQQPDGESSVEINSSRKFNFNLGD